MTVIYIPRDPRTKDIKFISGYNIQLLGPYIDEKEWNKTIDEINTLINLLSKIDTITILCNIFVFPIFFMKSKKLDDDVFKYLKYKNNILSKFGIFICHPKACEYNELRIVLKDENESEWYYFK